MNEKNSTYEEDIVLAQKIKDTLIEIKQLRRKNPKDENIQVLRLENAKRCFSLHKMLELNESLPVDNMKKVKKSKVSDLGSAKYSHVRAQEGLVAIVLGRFVY